MRLVLSARATWRRENCELLSFVVAVTNCVATARDERVTTSLHPQGALI